MTKFNFGVIKATFTYYLNESENIFAKDMFKDFMKLIKESALLQTEFKVYKSLEDKYLPNENLAIKYIDENLKLFSENGFTRESLISENAKLFPLVEGLSIRVSNNKESLYNHIHTLIYESLKGKTMTDVDKLHESFTYVLEHIKNNKPKLTESEDFSEYNSIPKEFLIKKAIDKFNDKYNSLNEGEKKLFKTIISENRSEKQNFFNNLKVETVDTLTSLLGESSVVDERINESVDRINSMTFNDESYANDILSLYELKESLS